MARHSPAILLMMLLSIMLALQACDVSLRQQGEGIAPLGLVLLGTHGYTTFEELGRTIEDYDADLEYDETRLPDIQFGFPLAFPVTVHNPTRQAWFDPYAEFRIVITAPDGSEVNVTVPFRDALVQRRRFSIDGQAMVKETASAIERRLAPEQRRVFFVETPYVPKTAGVYTLLIELRSKNLAGMRVTRSGFTIHILEPGTAVGLPSAIALTNDG